MYAIDNALGLDGMRPAPASKAPSRTSAALAAAKAHFIARGWRPLVIRPPALRRRCMDVTALLLMNKAGKTAWLSARDWSALGRPVDAFRREMVCVRAARVDETILVYDGDFPENVVDAAAHEPRLKLIDAAALRALAPEPVAPAATAPDLAPRPAPVPASSVRDAAMPTRAQRLAHPARKAAHYLAQVMETRPMAAAERYFQGKFAHRLRQLDGERRKLKKMTTTMLALAGASLGFLAFNMVVVMQAPDEDASARVTPADPPPLPQPMPPPQGYVAQAAGVSGVALRGAYASPRIEVAPRMLLVAPASVDTALSTPPATEDGLAPLAVPASAAAYGHEEVEQAQRRADEAMQVIADSTNEVRPAPQPQAAMHSQAAPMPPPTATPRPQPAHPVDPAMADESSPPDPAIVD